MPRNPEEEASEEAQTRRSGVSRKRLRAWILVLVLLALTVYAAVTDSVKIPLEWAKAERSEIRNGRLAGSDARGEASPADPI